MKSILRINRVIILALFFGSIVSPLKAQLSGDSAMKASEKITNPHKKGATMQHTIEKTVEL